MNKVIQFYREIYKI